MANRGDSGFRGRREAAADERDNDCEQEGTVKADKRGTFGSGGGHWSVQQDGS